MQKETKCVQSGYTPANGEPRAVPIAMSTTYKYDSAETVGDLFDLKAAGFFYTRLANPTTAAVEAKIADLEGGPAAMITASGMSATLLAILNVASAGDHIVSAGEIYGGTANLFAVTLKRMGIGFTFVDINDLRAVEAAITPDTKAVFGETIANPALTVMDTEGVAAVARKHGIPLIVDATFATPVLCRPFEWGADVVVHSSSKYIDGHAVALGGVIVESGKFDWAKSGKFPSFTAPDESYHGLVYCRDFSAAPFITKARVQLMRDLGAAPSPMNAFLMNLGLETLHLRMPRHSQNALAAAEFLSKQRRIISVKYPGLKTDPDYARAQKYLDNGHASGVVTFDIGDRESAVKFMNALRLASIVVHVADAKTSVLHPASSTHRQLTDAQLAAAGIGPGTIRLSVGIENIDDIIADLERALRSL
ncbi:MAG: O-acetylhomoserine aminocarboxypropyltransferase/cysteine synthase [Clostridiales bacterium]|jgi:O-acetylhomoserine (thiol)-lyase|nr:O-acetylhomoserine aminocarboxypropyltransferase/cysteine synthase [Clostridiales bacterium]